MQAVVNLVENAIKYTDKGGYVRVTLQRQGQMAAIVVKDNGCGISEDALEQLFERFYRVDKAKGERHGRQWSWAAHCEEDSIASRREY